MGRPRPAVRLSPRLTTRGRLAACCPASASGSALCFSFSIGALRSFRVEQAAAPAPASTTAGTARRKRLTPLCYAAARSSVLQLLFERRDGLREHLTMRGRSRAVQIRSDPRKRQLDRAPSLLCLALLRRQRPPSHLLALGLRLLKLDVLTLEPARHVLIPYP